MSARKPKPKPTAAPMELPEELGRLLAFMRKRTGMYFGGEDYLRHFESMVMGYGVCAQVNGCANPLDLGQEFAEWLVKKTRVGGGTATGWVGVLSRKYPNPAEAYDRFFDLLAEYRGWPPIKLEPITPISGTSQSDRHC